MKRFGLMLLLLSQIGFAQGADSLAEELSIRFVTERLTPEQRSTMLEEALAPLSNSQRLSFFRLFLHMPPFENAPSKDREMIIQKALNELAKIPHPVPDTNGNNDADEVFKGIVKNVIPVKNISQTFAESALNQLFALPCLSEDMLDNLILFHGYWSQIDGKYPWFTATLLRVIRLPQFNNKLAESLFENLVYTREEGSSTMGTYNPTPQERLVVLEALYVANKMKYSKQLELNHHINRLKDELHFQAAVAKCGSDVCLVDKALAAAKKDPGGSAVFLATWFPKVKLGRDAKRKILQTLISEMKVSPVDSLIWITGHLQGGLKSLIYYSFANDVGVDIQMDVVKLAMDPRITQVEEGHRVQYHVFYVIASGLEPIAKSFPSQEGLEYMASHLDETVGKSDTSAYIFRTAQYCASKNQPQDLKSLCPKLSPRAIISKLSQNSKIKQSTQDDAKAWLAGKK